MDVMAVSTLLQLALCGYVAGALAGLLFLRHDGLAGILSFGAASAAAVCGILVSVMFLIEGSAANALSFHLLPALLPYVEFSVRLDPLSAFFLLIISSLALAISIFSIGYVKGFHGRKSVGVLGAFYNALLLATTLVATADNAFFFLIAW